MSRSARIHAASDEDAETAIERVSGYPRFMRTSRVTAAGDHGRLNALSSVTGNAFDVEDRERHRAYCSEPTSRLEQPGQPSGWQAVEDLQLDHEEN